MSILWSGQSCVMWVPADELKHSLQIAAAVLNMLHKSLTMMTKLDPEDRNLSFRRREGQYKG